MPLHGDLATTVALKGVERVRYTATHIECRLCGEVKEKSQYAPNRRQCNRCRNRYTERVRELEKRRAYGRVRATRYRLKKKQAQADIGPIVSNSTP